MSTKFYIALTLFFFSFPFTGRAQVYQLFGTRESSASNRKATYQFFEDNSSLTETSSIGHYDAPTLRAADDWYVGLPCPQCSIGYLDEDGKCPNCGYVFSSTDNGIGAVDPFPIGDGLGILLVLGLVYLGKKTLPMAGQARH